MSELFAGRYLKLGKLGAGGMGEVWLARDTTSGAECALKHAREGATADLAATLQREFSALVALRHPTLVRVFDLAFTPEGQPYLTMEYVPGLRADEALADRHWPSIIWLGARVARGLAALHAAHIIHGDIKPDNILVMLAATPGQLPVDVRIVDLGLSTRHGAKQGGRGGTVGFAAPELLAGHERTPAADLYSLGATLYKLITGVEAAAAASSSTQARRGTMGPPPKRPLEAAGAPAPLVQLILQMLADQPDQRPRDAREVARALEAMHADARAPLASRLDGATLTGRERELARITAAMQGERARVLFVHGAPGLGRTALLEQASSRAAEQKRVTLRIEPRGSGRGAALLPFLRSLAAAARGEPADATTAAALEDHRDELSEAADQAVLEAAARWLQSLAAARTPAFVCVDDADRADVASRALLRRLLLATLDVPGVWLLGVRSADSTADPTGPGARTGLADPADSGLVLSGVAESLAIKPLDEAGIARLVATRLGDTAPEALASFLYARADGVPGRTIELLRAAVEAGAVTEDDDGIVVDGDQFAALPDVGGFEAALLHRAQSLPAAERDLLLALAACGGQGSDADLEALGQEAATLDAALATGLVRRRADERLALAPLALTDALLGARMSEERLAWWRLALARPALPAPERHRLLVLCGDLAEALVLADTLFAAAPDAALARTSAEQAEAVGHLPLAATWHERAAEESRRRGRYAESAQQYARAIALDPEPASRSRRFAGRCRVLIRLGRIAELAAARLESEGLALEPADRAQLLVVDAVLAGLKGEGLATRALAAEAARAARAARAPDAEGMALIAGSNSAALAGDLAEAERLAREALSVARAWGSSAAEGRAVAALARPLHTRGATHEALSQLAQAAATARERDERLVLYDLLAARADLSVELGDWKQGREHSREALRLALELDLPSSVSFALASLSMLDALSGRGRRAIRLARRVRTIRRANRLAFTDLSMRSQAVALRQLGQPHRAERLLRRMLERFVTAQGEVQGQWQRIDYVKTCILLHRWSDVAATLAVALPDEAHTIGDVIALSLAGRAALRLARTPREERMAAATRRLEQARPYLALASRPYAEAHALQLEGELAILRGDDPAAEQALRGARELLDALPAPADAGALALQAAQWALANGRGAGLPIAEWLAAAGNVYERLGDESLRAEVLETQLDAARALERTSVGGDPNLLDALSGLLRSLSDMGELSRRALRLACERFGAERGVMLLYNRETGEFEPIADHGAVDDELVPSARRYSRQVVANVRHSKASVMILDASSEGYTHSLVDMRVQSVVCAPISVGGEVIGAVYLDDRRRPRVFSDADRRLLDGFAQLLSEAVARGIDQQAVEQQNALLVTENLALRHERATRAEQDPTELLIGAHPLIQKVRESIHVAARLQSSVLITGESGTGKEIAALSVHRLSTRARAAFVACNCGALGGDLLTSELFGIESDVATGVRKRQGLFRSADGGTLFLDEIGDLPFAHQAALLRALQSREITPVGSHRSIPIDVRVIAATNRDLGRMVEESTFRQDLYYRLEVLTIHMPALRDRRSDIPILARHFIAEQAARQGRPLPKLAKTFLPTLMQSDWPGNVRELENYIERIMAMTPEGELLPDPLPRDLEGRAAQAAAAPEEGGLLRAVETLERGMIQRALDQTGGNQSKAAAILGIPEQSLRYRMQKYEMETVRRKLRVRN